MFRVDLWFIWSHSELNQLYSILHAMAKYADNV